ncbi:hypothetical protein COO60DRAFT_56045 [Scenedesmus sp. NREL 46B-D3]|nr:hypothetical protein COO60DRAFT_56045 [Scenedesmus sp. NREL 46B-D3]
MPHRPVRVVNLLLFKLFVIAVRLLPVCAVFCVRKAVRIAAMLLLVTAKLATVWQPVCTASPAYMFRVVCLQILFTVCGCGVEAYLAGLWLRPTAHVTQNLQQIMACLALRRVAACPRLLSLGQAAAYARLLFVHACFHDKCTACVRQRTLLPAHCMSFWPTNSGS